MHKGDPVAVVETAKSTIEVECFETGTMTELLVEPGTTVPVGTRPSRSSGRRRKSPGSPRARKKPRSRSDDRSVTHPREAQAPSPVSMGYAGFSTSPPVRKTTVELAGRGWVWSLRDWATATSRQGVRTEGAFPSARRQILRHPSVPGRQDASNGHGGHGNRPEHESAQAT
ncbi:biotin/lipoyl-containing protein [Streptomyces massasporeus]